MRANSEPTRVLCEGVSVLDSLIGPQRNLDGPLAHDVQSAMRERVLQRGGVAAELRCDCESCSIDVSDEGEREGYKALDVSDGGGSKGFRALVCRPAFASSMTEPSAVPVGYRQIKRTRQATGKQRCTAVLALDQRRRECDISQLNDTRNDAEYRVLFIPRETQRIHSTAHFIEIPRVVCALDIAASGMSEVTVVPEQEELAEHCRFECLKLLTLDHRDRTAQPTKSGRVDRRCGSSSLPPAGGRRVTFRAKNCVSVPLQSASPDRE